MAAAYSSGTSWSFTDDIPGSWDSVPGSTQTDVPSNDKDSRPSSKPTQEPPKRRRTRYPPRQCRICLETVHPTFHNEEDPTLLASVQSAPKVTYETSEGGRLLSPCKCKGSQKYVHEDCLGAWRRADPTQKRNYWECPTCRYRYRLQRLTWSSWINSTSSQLALTLAIFISTIFVLGFIADPIINLYFDPLNTIATAGGPGGSLIFEDEDPTWAEHFAKGMASLGLLGFAKFFFTLSPFASFNFRSSALMGGRRTGGTGRDRVAALTWLTIAIGIFTFLATVWKGVRVWSRRTLKQAGERVMDVPGANDEDDDDDRS